MTAGLVFTTLLAFSPPEAPTPADAPESTTIMVIEPSPPPPSMEWGPATDSAVSVAAPTATIVTVTAPPTVRLIPSRPGTGAGLFFGGMVAFSVGIGMQMQQFGSAAAVCNEWAPRGYADLGDCFATVDNPGEYMPSGIAFGSAIVLTSIGSAALGQREAWETHYGDRRVRNRTSRQIGGAVMLGLGIAAFATEGALLYMDWKQPCVSFECHVNRRGLWLGVADVGVVGLASGFGMLAWSSQYRHRMARYERLRWSMAPSATPHSVGGQVGLRF